MPLKPEDMKQWEPPVSPEGLKPKGLSDKFPFPGIKPAEVVKSGIRSVAGKILGGVGGSVAGVLLSPTEAGAGSDKVPPPSNRQLEVKTVGEPIKTEPLP